MSKKILTVTSIIATILAPLIASANFFSNPIPTNTSGSGSSGHDLHYIIGIIISYLNEALFLFMGVAVVMFVFYVIKYYMRPDADRTEAAKYVMWSVIGFFVILSFWGIVNILQNTFNLQNNNYTTVQQSFKGLFPTQ